MKKQSQVAHPVFANPSQTTPALLSITVLVVVFVSVILGTQSAPAQTYTALNTFVRNDQKVGLGKVLSSAYGGQIFGFDINENGTDGIITEALSLSNGGLKSAVETFDLKTGKITKIVKTLVSPTAGEELFADGIAGNDVALIDEERVTIKNGHVSRDDLFFVMNPVSGGKITGRRRLIPRIRCSGSLPRTRPRTRKSRRYFAMRSVPMCLGFTFPISRPTRS